MDIEIAKLWLNTGSLTTTPSQTGVRSANFMTMTFNFDLRIVLGETLWSKYKFFKMYINDTFNITTGLNKESALCQYKEVPYDSKFRIYITTKLSKRNIFF